ncbi:MAG: 16S rRNA (guanine(966)-N(2))-methyltransferase RsmD [Deltaproteobacteria bacterium]|jgi:16S rRNA (guanine966-N2)-methyltransferase|nr:16S rRNA (guanine(966)-N(2))-methyltransferase RsmD [Deltaproteobacteria bacterium]
MTLRISAGKKRGLKLHLPGDPSVRPTQSKVREAIFSMLYEVSPEAKVLDLYAGSGAMGLEAVSRGAKSAVFVDNSEDAMKTITKNMALFGECELSVVRAELPKECFSLAFYGPFDLIFMDPPYGDGLTAGENLNQMTSFALAAEGALCVWEMSASTLKTLDDKIFSGWELTKKRAWGEKGAAFFSYAP